MQVVILAGGLGTRLSEETDRIPKPMVTIGNKPILWHIMKWYEKHGLNDFIICVGYKSNVIIEYFANYRLHNANIKVDIKNNSLICLQEPNETWRVTIVDTGEHSETGGRLLRIKDYLEPKQTFCMTYGDGLSDVNIADLVGFHKSNQNEATLTAVRPPPRFGATTIKDGKVISFSEKPISADGYINGGFFVLEPSIFDLLENDQSVWEHRPLENLAKNGRLGAFTHNGFWQPMDTLRDRRHLEQLWNSGNAPWKWWKG